MIHHISIAANQPRHVAEVLAELCQGQVLPFPVHNDCYMVTIADAYGTMIVVLPRSAEFAPGKTPGFNPDAHPPNYSAFHAAISVPISEAQIHEIAAREGWQVETCDRAGQFSAVEVWIENQQFLEFLPSTFAVQYLAFTRPEALKRFATTNLKTGEVYGSVSHWHDSNHWTR